MKNKAVIIDMYSHGSYHEVINQAYLMMISNLYKEVTYIADKSACENLKSLLTKCNINYSNVRFLEKHISHFDFHNQGLNYLAKLAKVSFLNFIYYNKCKNNTDVFFNNNLFFAILLITVFSKKKNDIYDLCHNEMELIDLINARTHGDDGIYVTYKEDEPVSFNPFYTDTGEFDVEKRESIKTLILTLWKREDEPPRRSEEVALSGAVNAYIRRITEYSQTGDFNGFYEFVRDEYRNVIMAKNVREKDFDIDGFLNVLEPFYRGGDYDFLLNSDKGLDLSSKRFVVFELDNISNNKVLLPVVTLVIMETFIAKMRRLKGVRKMILIEECWKALMSANMSGYILYLFKTVRKYFGEAVVVTQEVDDIISSPIVKEAIINNSDCKILLDQRKYLNKFSNIQKLLGLSDKEKDQILSINQANRPGAPYREVWIGLCGTHSAVYATEVSDEEYLVYTTEETEKTELMRLAGELGGDIEQAVRRLAAQRRETKQKFNGR